MQAIRSFCSYALLVALVLGAYATARPYWNRYFIHRDMETAAVYGTKNSKEDTLAFLAKKMRQEGRDFTERDFFIEKEQNGRVTITLHYRDRIGLFGIEAKELYFTVIANATEVKEYF